MLPTKKTVPAWETASPPNSADKHTSAGTVNTSKPDSPVIVKHEFTPRLERFFVSRPSIRDLQEKNILIDAQELRRSRELVISRLQNFFEMIYGTKIPECDDERSDWQFLQKLEGILEEEGYLVRHCDICFGKKVGEGAYGEVFYAEYQSRAVAVKSFKGWHSGQRLSICRSFEREIESLMKTTNNPHVVPFVGACVFPTCCIVTDFKEAGSIHDLIHVKRVRFPLLQALDVAKQVADGMKAMHSLNPPLMHRDLTTENILIEPGINGKKLYAFIADFGISRFKTHNQPLSPIGHPRWKAPEISNKANYYSKKVASQHTAHNLLLALAV